MAKCDPNNRSTYWTDDEIEGISFLKADFSDLQYAPHVHDELVIAITCNGAGKSVTKRGADISTPGQVLVYNPYEPHSGGALENVGWCYRAFYIDRSATTNLELSLSLDRVRTPYFSKNCIQDSELASAMYDAHAVLETSKDALERQGSLLRALSMLYERHAQPRFFPEREGHETQPLKQTIDYMQVNYSSSISMAELAGVAGLSEYHFMRVFRKHLGLSPHAYLTQIRLRAARRLLQSGFSGTEAAAEVGFCDQSHLVRHFKRVYGITPAQYAIAAKRSDSRPGKSQEAPA